LLTRTHQEVLIMLKRFATAAAAAAAAAVIVGGSLLGTAASASAGTHYNWGTSGSSWGATPGSLGWDSPGRVSWG
jgi:hypothetical protein